MRKYAGYFFIVIIFFVLKVNGQVQLIDNNKIINASEQDYFYVYTEAIKLSLFGDYIRSLSLFNECLKIKPNSAAVHFQISQIYYKAGDIQKAKANVLLASKYDSENIWYIQLLADIYELQAKYDSSIIMYKKIIERSPDNPDILMKIATLYETEKKYKEAMKYLDSIDKIFGNSKEVAIIRYRIYEKQSKSEKAYDQLKFALNLGDDEYSLNGMMAEFYHKNKMQDSAQVYYSKIYPDYKEDPLVVFSISEFLMDEGNYDSTRTILIDWIKSKSINNALKNKYIYGIFQEDSKFQKYKPILDTVLSVYYDRNIEDIAVNSIFADIEFKLGNFRKSATALKRIISLDRNSYPAYEQLIYCENITGNEDSVIKYSEMALINFKEISVPYLFYGSALLKKENYNEAIEVLNKGLAYVNESDLRVQFYSLLAECYNENMQYENSDFYYNAAIKLDEENNGIKNNYAYYLALRKERLNFAKKLSKQTLKIEPKNSTYLDTYGWILFMQEKYKTAERYIKRAISNGGNSDNAILLHYSDIQLKLNLKEEAIETLNEALKFSNQEESDDIKKRIKELK
jgi:tetratricopeptide (TPR) repeat protein